MRSNLYRMLVFSTMLVAPMLAWASGQATPDEAKAMAIKAAAYLQSAGPEKAFPEFDAKDGPWHDRDLYVTVQNSPGRHGGARDKSRPDRQVDARAEGRGRQAVQSSKSTRSRTPAGSNSNGRIR